MRSNARLPKKLCQKIQKLRKRTTNLSQEDLANKIGVSRAYMGFIEQGRSTPSVEVLEKIAKALRIPISKLFELTFFI
jgi:DNA-binding XRE family transcriptional regulator